MAERDERDPAGQPLQVKGKAMLVFTVTAPDPDHIERLGERLRPLAERLLKEYGAEIEADSVVGQWEVEVNGVERSSGGAFGPDNQLGALSAWQDILTKTYPAETRTSVEQSLVNQHTALIQEFATAESADDPVAARKAILARLERELREQVRRLTGEDPGGE